jgi:phosphoribosylglycinamide formyltransferase-1
MKKMRVAVLISGRGSNMETLIEACRDKKYPAGIVLVISNRPGAKGLDYARRAGIQTEVVDHMAFETRDAFDQAIHTILKEARIELVCLAGFMRVLNPPFVNRWRDRILNIHPSLLPAFKGLHTHERVLEAGLRFTGCTVHIVRPEMDDGPIVIQAVVPITPEDTPGTLAAKVLEFEHRIYPRALRMMAQGEARVSGNLVYVKGKKIKAKGLINPPL